MNFFEFKHQLGVDPASRDPEFLRARESSPEFIQAATESDRFESRLSQAFDVTVPSDLLISMKEIVSFDVGRAAPWRNYAMAAGLLLALTVAGMAWRANIVGESVEQFVALHYGQDGLALVAKGEGRQADNIDEILSRFQVELTPEARRMVGLIQFCPTPAGEGAHIVLNTKLGPITVIFMPDTAVVDGEMLEFDGMQAQLVDLAGDSAAVIGTEDQQIASFHALVQGSFVPLSAKA